MFSGVGRWRYRIFAAAVLAWLVAQPAPAQQTRSDPSELSLADLANTTVTSVAKKAQHLSQVPAAVFVISRDDIKRSGAMYIPEVLRLSPGVQAARINNTDWAVSVRGFDGRWSNKLLVLIDGRTIYSPLFSGVFWDEQLLPLENVERIEVIRGPGATIWGANAVNGVINIITRSALDTQGTSVSLTGGDPDRVRAFVQHGGLLGSNTSYRGYSQFSERSWDAPGLNRPGNWQDVRGGFRVDWRGVRDKMSLTADIFGASIHDTHLPVRSALNPVPSFRDLRSSPGTEAMLFDWERRIGDNSSVELRASYTHSLETAVDMYERRDTLDTEFQHRFALGSRNDVSWGAEFKTSADRFQQRETAAFLPDHFRANTASGFVQDEVALLPGTLALVAGTKLEHDSYMPKSQLEPGLQLLWTPSETHTFWTSVARAIRAPSRSDTGVEIALDASPLPDHLWLTPVLISNPLIQPEKMIAYEAGYRFQQARFCWDLAAYYNRYNHLRSVDSEVTSPLPIVVAQPIVYPLVFGNNQYGNGKGFEANTAYDLTKSVRLIADYSFLQLQLANRLHDGDISANVTAGEAPHHQGRFTAYWNLNKKLSFDNSFYFIDRLLSQGVPGYVSVVSHLGLQIGRGVTANAMADNLLDHKHLEFLSPLDGTGRISQPVGRSVRAGVTWQF